jgi:hypothetical protein
MSYAHRQSVTPKPMPPQRRTDAVAECRDAGLPRPPLPALRKPWEKSAARRQARAPDHAKPTSDLLLPAEGELLHAARTEPREIGRAIKNNARR